MTIPSLIKASDAYKFAVDVTKGKIVSGVRRKQACRRFLDDLDKSLRDHKYPWVFDIEKAYRPIDFIEKFLKPTKGDYDKMKLLGWQHFVESQIYGWVSRKTGLRRYKEALIIIAQGNGKSTMMVGNAAYGLTKDGERGAEIYCLANSRPQAKIIFDEAKGQIDNSPILSKHIRTTNQGAYHDKTHSKFEPLSTESRNLDGRNVHIGIFDEIHEYRDYKLLNVIKGKTKKRKQPLIIYITTLGTVIDGPLMDYYTLGCNILDNSGAISKRAADRMFVYIDEIDKDDEPSDYKCWQKANPSLGRLLRLDDLKDEYERVKEIPQELNNFINKQLNIFTNVDEMSFLSTDVIRRNNRELCPGDHVLLKAKLKGARGYGGLDLSDSDDFSSACVEFELPNNEFFLLSHTWVPIQKIREDKEKLDWRYLERMGWLTVVNAEYIDHTLIYDWFCEQRKLYGIDSIGYDPAKAQLLVQLMEGDGFLMNVVRQGELTLTAPLDHLKEVFTDGNVIHNNNALYQWQLGNVKLTKRSTGGTYLPTKQKQSRKIDAFAAHLNAHTEWMRNRPKQIPAGKSLATVIKLN